MASSPGDFYANFFRFTRALVVPAPAKLGTAEERQGHVFHGGFFPDIRTDHGGSNADADDLSPLKMAAIPGTTRRAK
jgi:hypothetical protein